MLEELKILLGREIDDKVALAYINRATSAVLKITKRTIDDMDILQDIILDLAVYRINLQGVEHLKNEKYSNAVFEYVNDIPTFIMKEIESLKIKKLRVL